MPATKAKKFEIIKGNTPMMVNVAEASDNLTTTRRNRGGTIERTDKYKNIDAGALPFNYSMGTTGGEIDARDMIILCQKAYYNVALVRNIIDLMTEFSVGNIYFEDGNVASRSFFKAWWDKINGVGFEDRFFREYYRSGNPTIVRYEDSLQPGDVKKITQAFGAQESKALVEMDVEPLKLPARYVLINPADIMFAGNIAFNSGIYYKKLTDYELMRLRNPKTDEDKEVLDSLPPEVKKQIAQRNVGVVNLPLDPDKVIMVFYKKQDYEAFAVPMIYPVLEDLNFKIELKKLDMAIARTQQQVILLVTTGAEPDKGGINQDNIKALQKLLGNESIGRVLVADYTTKASFVIPDIGDILTPIKYEQLDKDINMGLNNILIGGEKFANQSAKVEVFLARLKHGREMFLREFLIPEIRRISKSIGFKSYPMPYFEDITLDNNDVRDRIYVQMAQLGLLTPEETVTALDSGRLPDGETSLVNQQALKEAKDKGLYQPIAPPQADAAGQPSGRPAGSPSPQLTKHVTPIGGSETFSTIKLVAHLKTASALQKDVEKVLKAKFGRKQLTQAQKDVAYDITKIIVANEEPENWQNKMSEYCNSPIDKNHDRVQIISELASEHETDLYTASLLYVSKTDEVKTTV